MEEFLIGFFEGTLKKYISNFRREQLSLSFVKGRGGMEDLIVNCDELNSFLEGYPFRIGRIHINRLTIKATLTKLKTEAIILFVDCLDVEIVEPVCRDDSWIPDFDPLSNNAKEHKYGTYDRIGDAACVEINEIRLTFRTLGLRKCRKPGPWTPPPLLLVLKKCRYYTTDEFGTEVTMSQGWEYNKNRKDGVIYIFKKLDIESSSWYLLDNAYNAEGVILQTKENLVIDEMPMDITFVTKRLYHNASVIASEMSVNIFKASMNVRGGSNTTWGLLQHFVIGICNCWNRRPIEEDKKRVEQDRGRGLSNMVVGDKFVTDSVRNNGRRSSSINRQPLSQRSQQENNNNSDNEDDSGSEDETTLITDNNNNNNNKDDMIDDIMTTKDIKDGAAAGIFSPKGDNNTNNKINSIDQLEEPPHPRSVIVLNMNHVEFRLWDDDTEDFFDYSKEGSRHDVNSENQSKGWILKIRGLLMESIWDEHSSYNQGHFQCIFHYLELQEMDYEGKPIPNSVLLRPSFDEHANAKQNDGLGGMGMGGMNSNQMKFPDMVARGVREDEEQMKEYVNDIGFGESRKMFSLKTWADWPPPPPPKVGYEVQCKIDPILLVLDVKSWDRLIMYTFSGWDPRINTGDWNDDDVENSMLQKVAGYGITEVILKTEYVNIYLPPEEVSTSSSDGHVSELNYFFFHLDSIDVTIDYHLSHSFLQSIPGFLNPNLIEKSYPSASGDLSRICFNSNQSEERYYLKNPLKGATESTNEYNVDDPKNANRLLPWRCQIAIDGISIEAPFMGSLGKSLRLIDIPLIHSIISIDPIPGNVLKETGEYVPPEHYQIDPEASDMMYLPLDRRSILTISVAINDIDLSLHLGAWITFSELLMKTKLLFKEKSNPFGEDNDDGDGYNDDDDDDDDEDDDEYLFNSISGTSLGGARLMFIFKCNNMVCQIPFDQDASTDPLYSDSHSKMNRKLSDTSPLKRKRSWSYSKEKEDNFTSINIVNTQFFCEICQDHTFTVGDLIVAKAFVGYANVIIGNNVLLEIGEMEDSNEILQKFHKPKRKKKSVCSQVFCDGKSCPDTHYVDKSIFFRITYSTGTSTVVNDDDPDEESEYIIQNFDITAYIHKAIVIRSPMKVLASSVDKWLSFLFSDIGIVRYYGSCSTTSDDFKYFPDGSVGAFLTSMHNNNNGDDINNDKEELGRSSIISANDRKRNKLYSTISKSGCSINFDSFCFSVYSQDHDIDEIGSLKPALVLVLSDNATTIKSDNALHTKLGGIDINNAATFKSNLSVHLITETNESIEIITPFQISCTSNSDNGIDSEIKNARDAINMASSMDNLLEKSTATYIKSLIENTKTKLQFKFQQASLAYSPNIVSNVMEILNEYSIISTELKGLISSTRYEEPSYEIELLENDLKNISDNDKNYNIDNSIDNGQAAYSGILRSKLDALLRVYERESLYSSKKGMHKILNSHIKGSRRHLKQFESIMIKIVACINASQVCHKTEILSLHRKINTSNLEKESILGLCHTQMSGWLRLGGTNFIQGKKIPVFPKFWCVLRNHLMIFLERPNSLEIRSIVPLHYATFEDMVVVHKKQYSAKYYKGFHAFSIKSSEDKSKGWVCVCETEDDKDQWIDSINKMVNGEDYTDDANSSKASNQKKTFYNKKVTTTNTKTGNSTSFKDQHPSISPPKIKFSKKIASKLSPTFSSNKQISELKKNQCFFDTILVNVVNSTQNLYQKQELENPSFSLSTIVKVNDNDNGNKNENENKYVISRSWRDIQAFHRNLTNAWLEYIDNNPDAWSNLYLNAFGKFSSISAPLDSLIFASDILIGSTSILEKFTSEKEIQTKQFRIIENYFSIIFESCPLQKENIHLCSLVKDFLGLSDGIIGGDNVITHKNISLEDLSRLSDNNNIGKLDNHLLKTRENPQYGKSYDESLSILVNCFEYEMKKMKDKIFTIETHHRYQNSIFNEHIKMTHLREIAFYKYFNELIHDHRRSEVRCRALEKKLLMQVEEKDQAAATLNAVSVQFTQRLMNSEMKYDQLLRKMINEKEAEMGGHGNNGMNKRDMNINNKHRNQSLYHGMAANSVSDAQDLVNNFIETLLEKDTQLDRYHEVVLMSMEDVNTTRCDAAIIMNDSSKLSKTCHLESVKHKEDMTMIQQELNEEKSKTSFLNEENRILRERLALLESNVNDLIESSCSYGDIISNNNNSSSSNNNSSSTNTTKNNNNDNSKNSNNRIIDNNKKDKKGEVEEKAEEDNNNKNTIDSSTADSVDIFSPSNLVRLVQGFYS